MIRIRIQRIASILLLTGSLCACKSTAESPPRESGGSSTPAGSPAPVGAGQQSLEPLGDLTRTFIGGRPSPPPSSEDWQRAGESIRRLSVDVFPGVPDVVRAELKRRGCLIPQTYVSEQPHNVIAGRFMSATTTDWAVLCSRDGASSLLVFQGGLATSVVEMESSADTGWLQGIGDGAIGFSHAIGVASPEYMREHYERYGGPKPPSLDHDGINDIFTEKASTVRYWHNGQWLALQGAD